MSGDVPQCALKPCPFCGGAVQFRKALHISDGNTDAVIHAAPSDCGLVEFSDGSTDESILAKWNASAAVLPSSEELTPDQVAWLHERADETRRRWAEHSGCSEDSFVPLREALERAEKYFELIRLKLINHLNEPERSAFWAAVQARDLMRSYLSAGAATENNSPAAPPTDATSQAIKDAQEHLKQGIGVLLARKVPVPMELHRAAHALSYALNGLGASPSKTCECGFSTEVCATNPCMRKKVHLAGLTPDSKWPDGAPIAVSAEKK